MAAKKNKATDGNLNVASDTVAGPEDAVLAGLLEELEVADPTVQPDGASGDEILEIEPDASAVGVADELIGEVSAQAADTVVALNAEVDADDTDTPVADVVIGQPEAFAAADDAGIDSLLDDVAGELHADGAAQPDADPLDSLLEDVASDAARIEAKQKLYAEQEAPAAAGEGDTPQEAAPGKKGGKKKDAAPKEPKAPAPSKVTHKRGDLLLAKLGAKVGDYLVFDADPAINDMKRDAFIERMNDNKAIADKVRDKILMLMTWMANGRAPSELNEVLRRAFTVLHEQGELTSGDKGNLQLNLLEKPYSIGTSRSQASQIFMLLPELDMVVKTKGKMVPNPNSVMLQAVNHQLGLV